MFSVASRLQFLVLRSEVYPNLRELNVETRIEESTLVPCSFDSLVLVTLRMLPQCAP